MPQSGFTPIITYNTATASAAPSAGNLTQGELAVNVTDKKLYTKNSGGSVVQVGSGPDATETLTNKTLTSPDINGGTIDGAVIGGSSAAAGSFTTLSASGDIVANGGAAAIQVVNTVGTSSRSDIQFQGTESGGGTLTYYLGVNPFATDGSFEIKPPTGLGYRMDVLGQSVFDHNTTSGNQFKVRNLNSGSSSDTTVFIHSTAGASSGVQSGTVLKVTGHPGAVAAATGKVFAVGLSGGGEESYSPLLEVAYSGAVTIPGSLAVTGSTLGYGTGAGGTVTQGSTSGKATDVTLNKACGTITTNNAALAAGASVIFLVSNNQVGFSDLVVVSITSVSPNWGDYEVSHQGTGAGAFFIKIKNTSGTSHSDAIEIVFSIIKGASS